MLGILLLMEDCGYCDNATISWQKQIMVVNFFIWIVGIILTVTGVQSRRKTKRIEKQTHNEEIKILKEKVESLEKDKKNEYSDKLEHNESNSQIDSELSIEELEKKIKEKDNKKINQTKPSAKIIYDNEEKENNP